MGFCLGWRFFLSSRIPLSREHFLACINWRLLCRGVFISFSFHITGEARLGAKSQGVSSYLSFWTDRLVDGVIGVQEARRSTRLVSSFAVYHDYQIVVVTTYCTLVTYCNI